MVLTVVIVEAMGDSESDHDWQVMAKEVGEVLTLVQILHFQHQEVPSPIKNIE